MTPEEQAAALVAEYEMKFHVYDGLVWLGHFIAAALAEKDRLLDVARSYLDCQLGPDESRCGDCVVDLKAEIRRLKIRCSEMPVDEVEEHFLALEAERDHWREAAVSVGQSDGHGWAEETKSLRQRVAELEAEARVQAQEARAQRATVHEIYQLCSGAKGEPGDWNAALPVKKALAAAKIEGLKMARDLMNRLISIGDMIRIIDAEIAALEKDGE